MDITGKDTNVVTQEKINESVTYHSPNIHSDWRVDENLTNTSMEMVAVGSTVMESSTCSSAPVVDSFGPHIWDHQFNAPSPGYCDMNVQYNVGTSSNLGPARAKTGWHEGAILKRGMFQPSFPTMLPQSLLPHLISDSGFIERAARFSGFGGGSFGHMMNPFVPGNPPLNPCEVMQGTHEVLGGNSVKPLPEIPAQGCGINVTTDIFEEGMFGGKYETRERSPMKKNGSFVASLDEAKHLGNESDEAEFSGHGTQEELGTPPGGSSVKDFGSKKRKRSGQVNERDNNHETLQLSVETVKENEEIKQKDDQNPATTIKIGGKNAKQGSQGSDPIKEGYVHIRARRGQATNSHSLAERVRREKISERMKFLQDLVPGCSKVTGKAVMLDEIINYVQSLQRQVEFLSMKLATVNPRLDFNIGGFVTKDMLQLRPGMPSSLVFPPDMTPFPPIHPSQHGVMQTALPATDVWEDELHNIVHMGFNSSAPNSQDLSGSIPPDRMKQEP